jgi:hypothetical protein
VLALECAVFLPPQEAPYETFRLPVKLPAVWGANETDKRALSCGATVMGRLGPAKLNPAVRFTLLVTDRKRFGSR